MYSKAFSFPPFWNTDSRKVPEYRSAGRTENDSRTDGAARTYAYNPTGQTVIVAIVVCEHADGDHPAERSGDAPQSVEHDPLLRRCFFLPGTETHPTTICVVPRNTNAPPVNTGDSRGTRVSRTPAPTRGFNPNHEVPSRCPRVVVFFSFGAAEGHSDAPTGRGLFSWVAVDTTPPAARFLCSAGCVTPFFCGQPEKNYTCRGKGRYSSVCFLLGSQPMKTSPHQLRCINGTKTCTG